MTSEIPDNKLRELLKQRLAEQTRFIERFEAAHPADEYKDEIGLGEPYHLVTEFRVDPTAFLVKHTPTTIIELWSVMTGPNRLKSSVETWVDEIHKIYPPKPTMKQ